MKVSHLLLEALSLALAQSVWAEPETTRVEPPGRGIVHLVEAISSEAFPVNTDSLVFLHGTGPIAVSANSRVWVNTTNVAQNAQTQHGLNCGPDECKTLGGYVTACFRPVGSAVPQFTAPNVAAFFTAPVADINRPVATPVATQAVFTFSAAGKFEFGVCAARFTPDPSFVDYLVAVQHIVALVRGAREEEHAEEEHADEKRRFDAATYTPRGAVNPPYSP